MIFVILGSLLVWVCGLSLGLFWDWQDAAKQGEEAFGPTWALSNIPPLAAWLAVEIIHLISPRRLFDRRIVAPIGRVSLGIKGAVIGFIIAVVFLPIVENAMPDWLTLAAASAIGTMIPTVLLPRMHKGHCALCDYDLRTLPSMERCPECGKTGVL
ncbi:MAG: hypothetical protein AABZ53_12185 [Planctomycetota bacterium]